MCVCECIITHAQSIKGRLWLQMRLQSQAALMMIRGGRLASFPNFTTFLQVKSLGSKNLLLKILICWCLTEVRSDKGHLRRQSGFSWQESGARVPSMIVLIRSDSGGMKDVRLPVMMWCHNRLPHGDHQPMSHHAQWPPTLTINTACNVSISKYLRDIFSLSFQLSIQIVSVSTWSKAVARLL